MRVKLVQLGRGVIERDVDPATTLRQLLDAEEIPTAGMEVRVNASRVEVEHRLEEDDLVTIVPMIKGGRRTSAASVR